MSADAALPEASLWRWVATAEAAELLAAIAQGDVDRPASLAKLRKGWSLDQVSIAIELTRARRKAEAKFPFGARLLADTEAIEQSTSHVVAQYKAKRFQASAPSRVFDLCCGVGGDAISLAEVAPVVAVDADSRRAWMCEQNLRNCVSAGHAEVSEARCSDVVSLDLDGLAEGAIHIDPSRRDSTVSSSSGRAPGPSRRWRYADYRPGPEFIAALLATNPNLAVKLGPGVELDELPDSAHAEVELIQQGSQLVQAVLWSGGLAQDPGLRTATLLESAASPQACSFTGGVEDLEVHTLPELERYLLVPQPALERAGLVGTWARGVGRETGEGRQPREMAAGLGLLTCAAAPESPWATAFEIVEVMPWRPSRVRQWLRAHDAGEIEVKTRGRAVDANQARRELRGTGSEAYTVFVLRLGSRVRAIVSRRQVGSGGV